MRAGEWWVVLDHWHSLTGRFAYTVGPESRMNTGFIRSRSPLRKPAVVVGVGLVLWVLWLWVVGGGVGVVPESFCSLSLDLAYKRCRVVFTYQATLPTRGVQT